MKVMIDIETLSTEHNAVVLSIGAVRFTEDDVTEDIFYRELDRESQEADRHISRSTVEWWSTQENPPPNGDYDPEHALQELSYFCGDCEEFWFRGPTFDAVILENLADQYHVSVPWKFWQIRDARTFDSLGYTRYDKKKVSHNALEDAIEQAKDVVNVFGELKHQLDTMRSLADSVLMRGEY